MKLWGRQALGREHLYFARRKNTRNAWLEGWTEEGFKTWPQVFGHLPSGDGV